MAAAAPIVAMELKEFAEPPPEPEQQQMAAIQKRMQMLIRSSIVQKPAQDKVAYDNRMLIRRWRELHGREHIDNKQLQPFQLFEDYLKKPAHGTGNRLFPRRKFQMYLYIR